MKKTIVFLLIIVSVYGCKKDNSFDSSGLIGEWSWLVSCGGFAGCSTPKNTNSNTNLVFTIDSMYYVYRNGTLTGSSRFHVSKYISADNKIITDVLIYDSGRDDFSIKHDTLTLNSFDGIFRSSYKRIK
jgi:hypothetical protein